MTLRPGSVHVALATIAVLAAGCGKPLIPQTPPSVFALRTSDAPPREPTSPDGVAIVAARTPAGEYDVLGVVAITAYGDDDPLALLRSAAASLGADVVTEIRLDPTSSSNSVSGVALGVHRPGAGRPQPGP